MNVLRCIDSGEPRSTEDLIAIVGKAHDARLVQERTARLTRAIKSNPSLLTHPSAKGQSGLERLRTLSARTLKAMKGDGRESRNKIRRAVGDGLTLPLDDEPSA